LGFIILRLGFPHRANTIHESSLIKMNFALVKVKGEQISKNLLDFWIFFLWGVNA